MGTYSYIGTPKFVTVQADGTYDITAYGAQGGTGRLNSTGGAGAEVGGSFTLKAGERLEIITGGAGVAGGINSGGGGGGGSFVLANTGPNGSYQLLLAGGGGGGGGGPFNGTDGIYAASQSGTGTGGTDAGEIAGGGGSGYKGNGGSFSANGGTFSYGGSNRNGATPYAGGRPNFFSAGPGRGGFGGGGGGGYVGNGGGGGGGYTGGDGGSIQDIGGKGGTSIDRGTALVAQSASAENAKYAGAGLVTITPSVCYVTGTLIRVSRGGATCDIAVEALRVGDLAMTASGVARPIRWLGHRTIDCRMQAQPRDVWPIRVAAHAFGDGLPTTDLFLSAGHSVRVRLVDDVLIPIGRLINGATIARHAVDEVTYWHVELDSHDVLIANNLPAESFLDCGNRFGLLEREGDFDRLASPHTPADFCLPFIDRGEALDAVRSRLAARAKSLGWVATTDLDMHLLVDGVRVDADIAGAIARFIFPAAATSVVLASATQVPSDSADIIDHRRLGVSIHGLELDDGLGDRARIGLDDALLAAGWHPEEAAAGQRHRFTAGHLPLPPSLWDGCRGQVVLRVHHDPNGTVRWLAPTADAGSEIVPRRTIG